MDDFNRPLYGDVFGVLQGAEIAGQEEIDRSLWGEIEPIEGKSIFDFASDPAKNAEDEEEEDEDEEEEDEEMPEEDERTPAGGLETPSGMATPSGMHSVTSTVPAGLETPAFAELRKKTRQDSEAPGPSQPRDLYQVIPEREAASKGFMGSSTSYDMSSVGGPGVLGAEDLGKKVS